MVMVDMETSHGRGIRQMLRNARRRHAQRKAAEHLLAMDEYLLRDVNLSRADVAAMLRGGR